MQIFMEYIDHPLGINSLNFYIHILPIFTTCFADNTPHTLLLTSTSMPLSCSKSVHVSIYVVPLWGRVEGLLGVESGSPSLLLVLEPNHRHLVSGPETQLCSRESRNSQNYKPFSTNTVLQHYVCVYMLSMETLQHYVCVYMLSVKALQHCIQCYIRTDRH